MAKGKRKMTRVASLSLATPRDGEDGYDYDNFGAIIGNPEFPGTGSLIIEVDHPERMDGDYPLRGRLVACKFLFPADEEEGEAAEEIVLEDIDESFLNVTFWEAVEAKPRKKKGRGRK